MTSPWCTPVLWPHRGFVPSRTSLASPWFCSSVPWPGRRQCRQVEPVGCECGYIYYIYIYMWVGNISRIDKYSSIYFSRSSLVFYKWCFTTLIFDSLKKVYIPSKWACIIKYQENGLRKWDQTSSIMGNFLGTPECHSTPIKKNMKPCYGTIKGLKLNLSCYFVPPT